jgi:hypothetical protein
VLLASKPANKITDAFFITIFFLLSYIHYS